MQLLSPSGSVINPGTNVSQAIVIANPNKVTTIIMTCALNVCYDQFVATSAHAH